MKKIDYKKVLKSLYTATSEGITVVDVPPMNFLMIDGKGDPNSSGEYRDAVGALYAVSYTIKFMVKKGRPQIDYGVMPLEGLWWVPDMKTFSVEKKDEWLWRMMIMQPVVVTASIVSDAFETVRRKKNLPALDNIRFGEFDEGSAVQTLYRGPYRDEGPVIAQLHSFIAETGSKPAGKHHEIYLNTPRTSTPVNLKTIIRQPMS